MLRDVAAEESPESGDGEAADPAPAKRRLALWQETVLLLAIAVVLAIVVKTFFVQAFYIPSESMEPGLIKNDRILVEKPSYWFSGTPQRGDVIVFQDPGGWLSSEESAGTTNPVKKVMAKIGLYPSGGHLVKRVIGVAGDTIRCCDEQGRLVVNGQPLDESGVVMRSGQRCDGPEVDGCTAGWTVGPVPAGSLFVMGDNRAHSGDSAYHLCHPRAAGCGEGPVFVPTSDVVGKVVALMWPLSRAHRLHRPPGFSAPAHPAPSGKG
jgi:signal peptidase I